MTTGPLVAGGTSAGLDAHRTTTGMDTPGMDVVTFARALDFAARRHCDQRRKGERREPYVNHVAEVALLVAEASAVESPGGPDMVAVVAGLLHDTIEDTETTREELAAAFGEAVAGVVVELSDDTSRPKAERKRAQVERARHASPSAKLVKMADKISNLRSLAHSPPAGWPRERLLEYVDWAVSVVAGLRGANSTLEALFDAEVARVRPLFSVGEGFAAEADHAAAD